MFTGLVETKGTMVRIAEAATGWKLTVAAALESVETGDSIACNGCCLTLLDYTEETLAFDLLEASLRGTSFRHYKQGAWVNLEQSLKVSDRLGGHFVTGHIDAVGTVSHFEPRGKNHYLRIEPPAAFMRYIAYKGSIAVDGISLTVAEVDDKGFSIWLIPHTLAVTNLHERKPQDPVNLEFDILAKYVVRQTAFES